MESLKLLLDQGIAADSAPLFRALGYQCHHVSEFGMQCAEDEEILDKAAVEGSVILTLDSDFHALMAAVN